MGGAVIDEPSDFHVQLRHLYYLNSCICIYMYACMQNEDGQTALFAACGEDRYDTAVLLINHRADVNYLRKVRSSHVP